MNEGDIPPPTDLKIGVTMANTLAQILATLVEMLTQLKQIATNTTPKK